MYHSTQPNGAEGATINPATINPAALNSGKLCLVFLSFATSPATFHRVFLFGGSQWNRAVCDAMRRAAHASATYRTAITVAIIDVGVIIPSSSSRSSPPRGNDNKKQRQQPQLKEKRQSPFCLISVVAMPILSPQKI